MTKQRVFMRLLMGLAAVFSICCAGMADRPNIIPVMTDDQGYAPLGRHGHPWIQMPQLDRLYDSSQRFTRYLVSPTCAPTRSAMMSGRHPMKNGITYTILERERMALDTVTLAQLLRDTGCQTGIFGKWHLGDEKACRPHQRGYTETFIHGAGGIGQMYGGDMQCSCADAPANGYHDPVILHNERFVMTKGADYAVSHGTVFQAFDADSVHVLDVRVPLEPNGAVSVTVESRSS